jgi:hypothetical protein
MFTLHNDVGHASVRSSISEVVKVAQTELRQLLARREEVTWRIRNLRQVVDGLKTFADQPASARNTAGHLASRPCSLLRSNPNQPRLSLLRACRIALMEGEGTASGLEIYSRIARRGSLSFVNSELAVSSIVGMLNAMTDDGEVGCFEDYPGRRWYRILGEEALRP